MGLELGTSGPLVPGYKFSSLMVGLNAAVFTISSSLSRNIINFEWPAGGGNNWNVRI